MSVSVFHLLVWGGCFYLGYLVGTGRARKMLPSAPLDPRIAIIQEALAEQDRARKAAEMEATRAAVLASLQGGAPKN